MPGNGYLEALNDDKIIFSGVDPVEEYGWKHVNIDSESLIRWFFSSIFYWVYGFQIVEILFCTVLLFLLIFMII